MAHFLQASDSFDDCPILLVLRAGSLNQLPQGTHYFRSCAFPQSDKSRERLKNLITLRVVRNMQRNTARNIGIPSAKDLKSIKWRALVACGMPFNNVTFRKSGRIAVVKLDDGAFEESREFSLGFVKSNVSRLHGCSLAKSSNKTQTITYIQ